MPKENDLEGQQDMGGKHGGHAGVPQPEQNSSSAQGIARDEKGPRATGRQIARPCQPQRRGRRFSGVTTSLGQNTPTIAVAELRTRYDLAG